MKAKLLFLLPAIAMLIACGSNNEQSSGNTSTSQGGTTSGETSQETSEGSSQETSSSEGGESSGGESSSESSEYQTVVFTPTESDIMKDPGKYQLTSGGVTISVSNGLIGRNQATNVIEIRIYKNATLTITANEITKAVFDCTAEGTTKQGPGCFSGATAGEYTYSGYVGTWTGKAPTFTLTASSNQVRCKTIEVTYK